MTDKSRGKTTESGTSAAKTDDELNELLEANEEFAAANAQLEAEKAKLQKELEAVRSSMAKSNKRLEAVEQQVGQDGTAYFDDDELVKVEQKNLDDPLFKQKLDMLKFMEEMVTVEIHETSEDLADPGFVIAVNNQKEIFYRGEQKTVKRYFVEGLARAKKTGFANKLVVDPVTGQQEYVYPAKTGLRYPFSVVEDRNPNGREWLKAVLRQP